MKKNNPEQLDSKTFRIRRGNAGVGFFAIAREERLERQKKQREVKKNARARLKSNS